ncbi:thioester domain-containing protein [Nocardiopsis listeri]|uniref:thioester domain-containing protein n=1 Tax=Nocardiopsis listeri TaxID=53440 RepID=UPI000831B3FC|nr:thioester domain-containing protein [Nocardiopsis listeri]
MKLSPSPRAFSRAGVAVSAAAFLALGLAAPAAADNDDVVRAQYTSNHQSGVTVHMDGRTIGTNLFNLDIEAGGKAITYCIDIETGIRSDAWYNEDDWANYPGKGAFADSEPGKVLWILQNGYPALSGSELATAAGTNIRVSDEEALGATQAAIWHFSNGASLDQRNKPAVKAVYDHLVENAEELAQSPASLSVSPDSATGKAGETVGEFVISTTASEIPVTLDAPDGVELVDVETGEAVTTVDNGDKVGFAVPEDSEAGQASFSLETTSTIQRGRLFKGEDPNKATQTLITAEDTETSVQTGAGVEWSAADQPTPEPEPEPEPEPTPDETDEPSPKPTPTDEPEEDDKPAPGKEDEPTLPVTGGALAGLVAAGIAALGAGGGAIYLSRKRKAGDADVTDA